jgi:hypothetical protein
MARIWDVPDYAIQTAQEHLMKPVRFRTTILALAVVTGSAITGVTLGRLFTKVVLAGPRQTAPNSAATNAANGSALGDIAARAAALGLRVRPDYPLHLAPKTNNNPIPFAGTTPVTPLPMWTYNVTASADLGGAGYSGQILGLSPFNRLKTTTKIAAQIVPLVITIDDGNTVVTYDPTVADPCVPGNLTDVSVLLDSPIFTSNNWTMNGVNVGNTQYLDAFQRAQFWSLVGGTPYHLILNPSVLPAQTLNVTVDNSSGPITNIAAGGFGGCGSLGIMQIVDLDNFVFSLMTGPLAPMINAGTFPIFLTKSVVSTDGSLQNCCIVGYHSAFPVGPNLQIYSPLSLDTTGAFGGGYTSVLAHEIGEAINDPTIGNATPPWGNIGQTLGFCQNNFEVGDPLTPNPSTPSNPFLVTGANGLTYTVQELAFFSWFFGGPSLGAGGGYSNNGTFQGDAILCPPGGTN